MKKLLPITILALTLVTTPAFAVSDKANENALKNKNPKQEVEAISPTPTLSQEITPTITVSLTPTITLAPQKEKKVLGESTKKAPEVSPLITDECSPNAAYKNHGEYVSCVAHQKVGGQAVSAAARSDIGKKNREVTPTASPTATPTISPTITPPLTSPVLASEGNFDPLASLGLLVDRFIGFIHQLV